MPAAGKAFTTAEAIDFLSQSPEDIAEALNEQRRMSLFQRVLCRLGLHGWHGLGAGRICESCGLREGDDV
jgi:hypothetical protein